MGHALGRHSLRARTIGESSLRRSGKRRNNRRRSHPSNCSKMVGDGETVIPSLPEPGVDRFGFGQCLEADEVEARENPSGLAATTLSSRIRKPDIRQQL